LYLPESWCRDDAATLRRRAKAHIPETIAFQTKPEIAGAMVRRTEIAGQVALDWITADEEYGRNGDFLDELEALGKRYVVEVPVNTTVWTKDPAECIPPYGGTGRVPTKPSRDAVSSVKEVAASWEATTWRRLCVGQGAKGPLCYEFAAVRVWAVRHGEAGKPIWLLVRRSLEAEPEIKYYVSNADETTPLEVLARVACMRHKVEDYFEDSKTYLGMAQYETRSWIGWHHHMSLVALAHLFITLTRRDLQKKKPELTLDRVVRLLWSAIGMPTLSVEAAIELVNYHINRNRIARDSHMKSWMAKNGDRVAKFVPL
jgi:SRSO17 transposase